MRKQMVSLDKLFIHLHKIILLHKSILNSHGIRRKKSRMHKFLAGLLVLNSM